MPLPFVTTENYYSHFLAVQGHKGKTRICRSTNKNFSFSQTIMLIFDFCLTGLMRPKARGLALHGCPPGWLEESDPASLIL
jgi:hypothetical protein